MKKLSPEQFRERLLSIMDSKNHWAWPHFSGSKVTKDQLNIHFRQEYAVYVRDFPVFLARVYGKNPPREVRGVLAKNIYEEDTGGLSLGKSHPDLFLAMMIGMGFARTEFRDIELLSTSRAYREWLDSVTAEREWVVGVAILTIFVEGSVNDRKEILHPSAPKTPAEIEDLVRKHPLVVYQGLAPECMDLVRAHHMVEPAHRHAAYDVTLQYAVEADQQEAILAAMNEGLKHWLRFRDGIARACGLRAT